MAASFTKQTSISIEGTIITHFQSLKIIQSLHTWHEFELVFDDNSSSPVFPFAFGTKNPLIGKKISLTIKGEDASMATLKFDGVIAEAEAIMSNWQLPGMVVRGHGMPYKLGTGPSIGAYFDQSVTDIVKKCLSTYSGDKKITTPTGPGHVLPYCVRYNETVWNFLRRLAYDYGAWLYYDGQTLHFTAAPGTSPISLKLGLNLHDLRSGTRAVAQAVRQVDYLSLDDKRIEAAHGTDAGLFEGPASQAQPGLRRALTDGDLTSFATNRSESFAAQASYVTGQSDVPGLCVGSTIRINAASKGKSTLGDFVVVEVTHDVTDVKGYHSRFLAIPAAVKAMPPGPLQLPTSEAQVGKVVANNDPRNLGRVQVRLQWMTGAEKTPWLRVVAPHYGPGKAGKSRGFMFVPEVDDQVMVGFQHGNPDRPFVFGAMPHGQNAAVPSPATKAHHLSVNSGTTVSFLDTSSKHELHLQVDDDNTITIVVNNGQGTITLNASKSIVLKAAKEITLDAPTITLKGGSVAISGNTVAIDANRQMAISGGTVDIKSDGPLNAKGTMTKVTGTITAALDSSGITTVKGTMVMIN